jgi:hypothetical protein
MDGWRGMALPKDANPLHRLTPQPHPMMKDNPMFPLRKTLVCSSLIAAVFAGTSVDSDAGTRFSNRKSRYHQTGSGNGSERAEVLPAHGVAYRAPEQTFVPSASATVSESRPAEVKGKGFFARLREKRERRQRSVAERNRASQEGNLVQQTLTAKIDRAILQAGAVGESLDHLRGGDALLDAPRQFGFRAARRLPSRLPGIGRLHPASLQRRSDHFRGDAEWHLGVDLLVLERVGRHGSRFVLREIRRDAKVECLLGGERRSRAEGDGFRAVAIGGWRAR